MSETDTPAPQDEAPAQAATTSQEDTSAASEQDQADAPAATQSTEGTTDEVKAEATTSSEEDGFLGGKYKTKQDFERAYKELKDKHDLETKEKAELTKVLTEAFGESSTALTEAEDETEYQEDETAGGNSVLAKEVNELKKDRAVSRFVMENGDISEDRAVAMKEILANDPVVKDISDYGKQLKYAFALTHDLSMKKAIEEAGKQAQVATEAKIAEKEIAQVESARKTEPIDEDAELLRTATTGKPADRAAARMAIIRKNLVNL